MKTYDKVKQKLIEHPIYRERSKKNEFTARWLNKMYPTLLGHITLATLSEIVSEVNNIDRTWRQVLQLEPQLRGKDYGKKKILEQEKMIELGYNPGQNQ